jgi:DNA invertase Pin-like site-specific DNA recombinase
MKNAIIYTRVYSPQSDVTNQIDELTAWGQMNGYNILNAFQDIGGKSHMRKTRKGLTAMFKFVEQNDVDIVLISELRHVGRSGVEVVKSIARIVDDFKTNLYVHEQDVLAYDSEGKLNTTFDLIVSAIRNIIKIERARRSETIRKGLAAAKEKGRLAGRPKGTAEKPKDTIKKYPAIAKYLRQRRLSIREIAKLGDVSPSTVLKVKQAIRVS